MTAELLFPTTENPSAVQRIQALYQQRELGRGEHLTTGVVADQVGVSHTLAKATLRLLRTIEPSDPQPAKTQTDAYASTRPSDLRGSPIGSDRIAALYRRREVAGGQHLRPAEVAHAAGVSQRYAMLTLYVLRALDRQGPAPSAQWAAARARAISPADRADRDLQRPRIQQQAPDADWRARAACADGSDPELFFPERSQAWKATKARAVCAGCGVQPACLEFALRTQTSQQDDHGIFAGTSRQQRLRLRGQAPIATPTRFLTDPKATAEAFSLARRVGVIGAAERLGVSGEALYHAFDRYGLGRPNGQRGSLPSRFLLDRHHAEQVFQRARAVGITRAAKEAGTSHRTLRKAWARHGLGLPERIVRPAAPPLDQVFLGLPGNHAFARPVGASGAACSTVTTSKPACSPQWKHPGCSPTSPPRPAARWPRPSGPGWPIPAACPPASSPRRASGHPEAATSASGMADATAGPRTAATASRTRRSAAAHGADRNRLPAGPVLHAVQRHARLRRQSLRELLGPELFGAYGNAQTAGTLSLLTLERFCDEVLGWHPRMLYGDAYDHAARTPPQ